MVRRNVSQGFAPDYDVPDKYVEDVRAMTYPAYKESAKSRTSVHRRRAATGPSDRDRQAAAGHLRRRGPDLRRPRGNQRVRRDPRRRDPPDPGLRSFTPGRGTRRDRQRDRGLHPGHRRTAGRRGCQGDGGQTRQSPCQSQSRKSKGESGKSEDPRRQAGSKLEDRTQAPAESEPRVSRPRPETSRAISNRAQGAKWPPALAHSSSSSLSVKPSGMRCSPLWWTR